MFDIWHKIDEKGAVAVPLNPTALTPLGWAEIREVYPELVPDEFRSCDVYSDPQLIYLSPFENEDGQEYLFYATDPVSDASIKCGICFNELLDTIGAKDYHADNEDSSFAGILTCNGCGIPGCDGLWSQSFHVSEKMIHWSIVRYEEEMELFFEREAYERGLIAMLHEMATSDTVFSTPHGSLYERKNAFAERVQLALSRRPYFENMWQECEEKRRVNWK